MPGASRLHISGQELRAKYEYEATGDEIRYTHKEHGAKVVFRCDPVRFGERDKFYHFMVDLSSPSLEVCSSGLDFYDPPPLAPVPTS